MLKYFLTCRFRPERGASDHYIPYWYNSQWTWLQINRFMASSIFNYQRCVGFSSKSEPLPQCFLLQAPPPLPGASRGHREISFSFIWNPAKHKHRTGILGGYTGCTPAMTTIQISSERNHSLAVLSGWIGCVLLRHNDLESGLFRGLPLCQAAWINKHSCQI